MSSPITFSISPPYTQTHTLVNFTTPLTTPERFRSRGLQLEVKKGRRRNGSREKQDKKLNGGEKGEETEKDRKLRTEIKREGDVYNDT